MSRLEGTVGWGILEPKPLCRRQKAQSSLARVKRCYESVSVVNIIVVLIPMICMGCYVIPDKSESVAAVIPPLNGPFGQPDRWRSLWVAKMKWDTPHGRGAPYFHDECDGVLCRFFLLTPSFVSLGICPPPTETAAALCWGEGESGGGS